MAAKDKRDEPRKRFSNTQMLLGAAGLFLFIVGVKRSLRTDDGRVVTTDPPAETQDGES